MLYTCGFSSWLAINPMKFQQLQWAAKMGDKTQPPTSIVVQTVCTKFFELPNADKARCRKARPSERGRELEAWCAVQGLLFSNLFNNLYGYIYFFSCFLSFCKLMGFSFLFSSVFKLIDWCFTFENLLEVVNFNSDNFLLTAGDLTDCCLFQFYQQIIISFLCLFVCVVLFLARRKICLGLLKKVSFN